MKNLIYMVGLGLALCGTANAQRIYHTVEKPNGTKDVVSLVVPQGWAKEIKNPWTKSTNEWRNVNHLLTKADEVGTGENGVMYVQTIGLDETQTSVEDIIAYEKMMHTRKTVKVDETSRIPLDGGRTEVRFIRVTGSVDGTHQVIAFIPQDQSVVTVTLTTPFSEFMTEHLDDFTGFVKSYTVNPHLSTPEVPLVTELVED